MLYEAVKHPDTEDHVVDELDSQYTPRFGKVVGNLDILRTGAHVSTGVVVGADHRGGTLAYRLGEHLSGVYQGAVDQPNGNELYRYDLMRSVERDAHEMFLWAIGVVV